MAQLRIDVVIPAYNEEDFVSDVLWDVTAAKQSDWFRIENIYVISDASTDLTDDIVQQACREDKRVKLVRKAVRKGKTDSINKAISLTQADVLVFIDADHRLGDKDALINLLRYFHEEQAALVQGGLVRTRPGFTLNPVKYAAYFDWILADKVRRQKPVSWWTISGSAMALSRDFYQHLVLPLSQADDQFIFYTCIKEGRKFVWAKDAVFYYGASRSVKDFCNQWNRYYFYTNKSRQEFGRELIDIEMRVPRLGRTIVSSILRHPLCGLAWALCYLVSRIYFRHSRYFEEWERGIYGTTSAPLGIPSIRAVKDIIR
ncbi:glycosyltransferase [Chloroflexota bacterium]